MATFRVLRAPAAALESGGSGHGIHSANPAVTASTFVHIHMAMSYGSTHGRSGRRRLSGALQAFQSL
jgi:hypothetical protein